MHVETLNLREVMVFLVAAGLVIPVFHRLRISPVLGYLIVGLLIGPYGLKQFAGTLPWLNHIVVSDPEGVSALAELGVVFLLFMIGIELSFERLLAMRRLVFGLGGAQVAISAVLIAAIAFGFGNGLVAAMVIGAALALSSTAIVMQLLAENRRLGTATGRTSFAILLFQDLAVLPILFLVAAFDAKADGSPVAAFALAIGQAAAAIAIIIVIGRLLLRPLFRFVGASGSREMFLALALLVIIGTALTTQEIGLSMALGAFMAGLLFAETEYRHAIEVDIEPFKGLLLGLFFISVGMSIDAGQLLANPYWLLASVVGLYLVKAPVIYLLVRLFGEQRSVALETSMLLGQGGEFAFVVFGLASGLGLIGGETAQFMLIVTGLTMIVAPLVAHLARRAAIRLGAREAERDQSGADVPADLTGHVIIVGYGRVGQMLGSLLEAQEIPHVALDVDTNLVARYRAGGGCIYFGDASRPEMLRMSGAERAAALVVTMDSAEAAGHVVATAHRHWPNLAIYARARDRAHARQLMQHGAGSVVPETLEASLQLSEIVLRGVGIPDTAARQLIDIRRLTEQAALDAGRAPDRD